VKASKPHKLRSPGLKSERKFLDDLYASYTVHESSQTRIMRELVVRTFQPFVRDGVALELGCSDGYMTEMLSQQVAHLDVVDGSTHFLREAKRRKLQNVSYMLSLFEEYRSETKYDYIFASFVLEHVLEVKPVLTMARSQLKEDGLLFVVVPNARALSRQLARHMGLLKDLKELTSNDIVNGHRRVYDRPSLNKDLECAGFRIVSQGGLMLKILADFQLDKLIDNGMLQAPHIDGLYKLGLEYPDLCGALFSVCRKQHGRTAH
jgi:2-polyprenyl-3-methyl-5-hydroxy-6-metoxy-1,4-benzoquinol methylase